MLIVTRKYKYTIFVWLLWKWDVWTLLPDLCAINFSVSFAKAHGNCAIYVSKRVSSYRNRLFPSGCFLWPLVPDLVEVQWNLLGNVTSFLDRCLRQKCIADEQWWRAKSYALTHHFLFFIKRDYSSKEEFEISLTFNWFAHLIF